MLNYLRQLSENTPEWLENHKSGIKPNISDFFSGRVVYYPGANFDGHPVKLFNSTHSAHCFFYVDYIIPKEALCDEISHHGFRGYRITDRFEYTEQELVPNGWHQHVFPQVTCFDERNRLDPYCVLFIFERKPNYDETLGADKLALLYLKGDGIATYDALFGNKNYSSPFCILIEDYGFGGNYNKFGRGGLLEEVAMKTSTFPQYYLFSEHSEPWCCVQSLNLDPSAGGMHGYERYLYINKSVGI